MSYLRCETAEDKFGNTETPCNNGDMDMNWVLGPSTFIDFQNRAYQREKVSTIEWKQDIMKTVLVNIFAGIPEIHIRVIETESGGYRYELIDGQQRITAIWDYLKGVYPLPKDFPPVNNVDVSGMYVDKLRAKDEAIFKSIMGYRISCKWYENINDIQTAFLFIHVLNNVNDMKPQEKRNAILGFYSTFVRDTARFVPHDLFARITETKGKTTKQKLKYFNFPLKGRMEVDEWLSELIYLWKNGVTKGVAHANHFNWVETMQSPAGDYNSSFVDEKKVNKLLNFALSLLKAANSEPKFKSRLSSMVSMMLVLYANELKGRYGNLIPETYVQKFFEVYDKYSDTSGEVPIYTKMTCTNGHPMGPFKELFGGKNQNAISTIFTVLNHELEKSGLKEFGIIEIDKTDFTRADVVKKWIEQDCKCYYTGKLLEEEDIVGDHYIPRSSGVENGGVTEYHNLVVTSTWLNNQKTNLSPEAFKKLVGKIKVNTKELVDA